MKKKTFEKQRQKILELASEIARKAGVLVGEFTTGDRPDDTIVFKLVPFSNEADSYASATSTAQSNDRTKNLSLTSLNT